MNDFLTRLVERSLGVGEVVRPRLGSLFEARDAVPLPPLVAESLEVSVERPAPAPVRAPEPVVERQAPASERSPERRREPPAPPASAPAPEPEHDPDQILQQPVTSSKRDALPPELPRHEPAFEVELERETQPQSGFVSTREERPRSQAPLPEPKPEPQETLQQSVTRRVGARGWDNETGVVPENESTPRDALRPHDLAPRLLEAHESWLEPPPQLAERPVAAPAPPGPDEPPVVRVTIGRVDVRAVLPATPHERSAPKRRPRLTLDEYLRDEGRR